MDPIETKTELAIYKEIINEIIKGTTHETHTSQHNNLMYFDYDDYNYVSVVISNDTICVEARCSSCWATEQSTYFSIELADPDCIKKSIQKIEEFYDLFKNPENFE